MTTDDEFAALEERWYADEQRRVDRVRVYGYTLATIGRVDAAKEELEKALDSMARARKKAERALGKLRGALDHAEAMARLVATGDAGAFSEVAQALEALEEKD